MRRALVLAYGLLAYVGFLAVAAYLAAFLANFAVPRSVDQGPGEGGWLAIVIDVLLIAAFGLQHTVMARPSFKKWWTRFVPRPIERSTYVMLTNLVLVLLFWQWRPVDGVLWDVSSSAGQAVLYGLLGFGFVSVVVTTFLINHFDLFGLRQVWLYWQGRDYTAPGFVMPAIYRHIRHPLYVGWLTAFWATPTMTVSHLLFAVGMTSYILVAIPFEERNLIEFHSEYADYRRRVPRFLPRLSRIETGTIPETT